MKWLSFLCIGLIAAMFRFWFLTQVPERCVSADSYSYMEIAQLIREKKTPLSWVNPIRAPVYPLFLVGFLEYLSWSPGKMAVDPFIYNTLAPPVGVVQSAIGVVTCLLFFACCLSLMRRPLAIILGVLFAANLVIVPWDRCILTESLSVLFVVSFLAITLLTLRQKKSMWFIILFLLGLVGIFLRPSFVGLFPITVAGLSVFPKKTPRILLAAFLCVLYAGTMFFYSLGNGIKHNNRIFQFSGTVNIFGRSLTHGYIVQGLEGNPIADVVTPALTQGTPLAPFPVLHGIHQNFYYDQNTMTALGQYNRAVLQQHFFRYVWDAMLDIPKTVTELNLWTKMEGSLCDPKNNDVMPKFFLPTLCIIQQMYQYLHGGMFLLLFTFPLLLVATIRRRKTLPSSLFVGGLILLWYTSLTALNVLGGFEDFGRLGIPGIPLLYVLFGILLSVPTKNP